MSSNTTRTRTGIAVAAIVCMAFAALVGAPGPQTDAENGTDIQLVAASAPEPSGEPRPLAEAVAPVLAPVNPAPAGDTRVAVSNVKMVVNDDGSATLSAAFQGRGEAVALKSVHITSPAGPLDVASTQMWLPIIPGTESRAGDASDAGGFVVPGGLAPGQSVHVQFQFDDDTCLAIDASAVRRNSTHAEVFPTNGKQLGPAKRTTAQQECPAA